MIFILANYKSEIQFLQKIKIALTKKSTRHAVKKSEKKVWFIFISIQY